MDYEAGRSRGLKTKYKFLPWAYLVKFLEKIFGIFYFILQTLNYSVETVYKIETGDFRTLTRTHIVFMKGFKSTGKIP